jgi:ribonuclease P protein component
VQKGIVYDHLDKPHIFMISYLGKEEWKYEDLYVKMEKLLTLFMKEVKNIKNDEI